MLVLQEAGVPLGKAAALGTERAAVTLVWSWLLQAPWCVPAVMGPHLSALARPQPRPVRKKGWWFDSELVALGLKRRFRSLGLTANQEGRLTVCSEGKKVFLYIGQNGDLSHFPADFVWCWVASAPGCLLAG